MVKEESLFCYRIVFKSLIWFGFMVAWIRLVENWLRLSVFVF